jgi:hypothetical protein
VIKGTSLVNGKVVHGMQLLVYPGKAVYDINVPPGLRQINIHDANILTNKLGTKTVQFFGNMDVHLVIRPNTDPTSPYTVEVAPFQKKN